jgi:hypothetical protein
MHGEILVGGSCCGRGSLLQWIMGCRGERRQSGSGLRPRAWVREWREAGSSCAKRQGGDKRSHRIEAYSDVILIAIEKQVDITLVELAELLRQEHGAGFCQEHDLTLSRPSRHDLQKNGARQRAGAARRRRAATRLVRCPA